jgi:hypothetical protein
MVFSSTARFTWAKMAPLQQAPHNVQIADPSEWETDSGRGVAIVSIQFFFFLINVPISVMSQIGDAGKCFEIDCFKIPPEILNKDHVVRLILSMLPSHYLDK